MTNRNAIHYCKNCGTMIPEGAAFCPNCGMAQPNKKKNKTGFSMIMSAFLAVVLFFTGCIYPGFLKPKPGGEGSTITTTPTPVPEVIQNEHHDTNTVTIDDLTSMTAEQLEAYISSYNPLTSYTHQGIQVDVQSFAVSEESLVAYADNGVQVELSPYIFQDNNPMTLSIGYKGYDIADNEEWRIDIYDISLGDLHELDDFVTIRLPFNTEWIEPESNIYDCVAAKYYDESTNRWEDILYTVDPNSDTLLIDTDHFSQYGVMKAKNKDLRTKYSYGNSDTDLLSEEIVRHALEQFVAEQGAEDEKTMAAVGAAIVGLSNDLMNVSSAYGIVENLKLGKSAETIIASVASLDQAKNSSLGLFLTQPVYKGSLADMGGKLLTRVGQFATIAKLTSQLVTRLSTGNELDREEFYGVYKDLAFLAASFSSSPFVGLITAGCWALDYELTWLKDNMQKAKRDQYSEIYYYFNEEYSGMSLSGRSYRNGRNATAWRNWIIKMIESSGNIQDLKGLESEKFSQANLVEQQPDHVHLCDE